MTILLKILGTIGLWTTLGMCSLEYVARANPNTSVYQQEAFMIVLSGPTIPMLIAISKLAETKSPDICVKNCEQ